MIRLRSKVRMTMLGLLPKSLMAYPFEAFVAVYGLLAGALVTLTGAGVPESLSELVPDLVVRLLGVGLFVGAATVALGLRRRWRLALPVGMRLVAVTIVVIVAASLWADHSLRMVPNSALLLFIAALAGARSLYLRATAEVKHRLRTEGGR